MEEKTKGSDIGDARLKGNPRRDFCLGMEGQLVEMRFDKVQLVITYCVDGGAHVAQPGLARPPDRERPEGQSSRRS